MNETDQHYRSKVTRQDRAIEDEAWIVDLLNRAGMASIATAKGEQPFLSTLLFAYEPGSKAIYFHTGRKGRVWENIQSNPQVCLSAAEMGRLLPADTALNFSVEYQSVVVFGPAHLIADQSEAEYGLQLILDKYFPHLQPGRDYRSITESELSVTAVFRLDIEEWSGKRKSVGEAFTGAFRWNENNPQDGK